MRLAVMQPYVFPYLGYFQLIHSVDRFVFYDDVSYIKQGWINRNRLLVGGDVWTFSIPVRGASSFALIKDTEVDSDRFIKWRRSFLRTLSQSYARSPSHQAIMTLIDESLDMAPLGISAIAERSIELCCEYLGIETEFLRSSRDSPSQGDGGQRRIIDLCSAFGAAEYVNASGGRNLYDEDRFAESGVRLSFLRPQLDPYSQGRGGFVPGLSILDLMFRQSRTDLAASVSTYEVAR